MFHTQFVQKDLKENPQVQALMAGLLAKIKATQSAEGAGAGGGGVKTLPSLDEFLETPEFQEIQNVAQEKLLGFLKEIRDVSKVNNYYVPEEK